MGILINKKKKHDGIVVIGLTGQSGSGKTYVGEIFTDNGINSINADLSARAVTVRGSSCNKALSKYFPECFNEDLEMDRSKLARIVFNDSEKLSLLNSIIFPYITNLIKIEISEFESNGEKIILLDAPTLFEAKVDELCDIIVSVVADDDIREERIIRRDKISSELARSRFNSQHTKEFFIKNSDYVIENNGSKEELYKSTVYLIGKLREKFDV